MSMIARLRGLAAAAVVAVLALSMLGQTAAALGAALLISALLWAGAEITARDLRAARNATATPAPIPPSTICKPARGPHAYRQSKPSMPTQAGVTVREALKVPATGAQAGATGATASTSGDTDIATDPHEAAIQEVKRLRMAGAI